MSKVTVVLRNPRKNRNSWILVDQSIKDLTEEDIENEIFYLNDMNIKFFNLVILVRRMI